MNYFLPLNDFALINDHNQQIIIYNLTDCWNGSFFILSQLSAREEIGVSF